MKSKHGTLLVGMLALIGLSALGGVHFSPSGETHAEAVDPATNILSGGDLSDFTFSNEDITMPKNWNWTPYNMITYAENGNSLAIVTKSVDSNPCVKMVYDGTSTGDNSNLWIWVPDTIKAGAGDYVLSFDLQVTGLSTGDFVGWQLLGATAANNYDGAALTDSASYAALADSSVRTGWKHFSTTISQTEARAATNDTIAINLYNRKNTGIVAYFDNISVQKSGTELLKVSGTYVGDFSCYYQDKIYLGVAASHGYGSLSTKAPAYVTKDGDHQVVTLGYGTDDYSSLYKMVTFYGPGSYRFECDLKYSDQISTTDVGFAFNGADQFGNTAASYIGNSKADLDALDNSTVLTGYKHFSGSLFVDWYMSKNIDSLALWCKSVNKAENQIAFTNLALYYVGPVEAQAAPSIEAGKTLKPLVYGGDFANLADGYTMIPEPTDETKFWGSIAVDSPGVVATLDGKKCLRLAYDGKAAHAYASAFVFLDPLELNTNDVYELSYEFKANLVEGNSIGNRFHAEFVGGTGVENYKFYFNNLNADHLYTSGMNRLIYPVTVSTLENGWVAVKILLKLNNFFLSTVNSLRFILFTESNANNALYVANCHFGAYRAESETSSASSTASTSASTSAASDSGTDAPKNSTQGWIIGGTIGGVVLLGGVAALVIYVVKKRKGAGK
jgi:hypothetical protein